jgi:hypothetical protein
MKLHEEFKLFENMWDESGVQKEVPVVTTTADGTIVINCNNLTEGLFSHLGDLLAIKGLKFAIKHAPEADMLRELQNLLTETGRDRFGKLEAPPIALNKHRVAAMMYEDLKKLSADAWKKKWWIGYLKNGNLSINPADYPELDFSALLKTATEHPGNYGTTQEQ